MKILLTGASGMLGRYLYPLLKKDNVVTTLQREGADICCDLAKSVPEFGNHTFDMVVHVAGTSDETEAIALNHDGTKRLLAALEQNPPKEFVFVSSWEVYSPDSGENVKEDHPLWAATKVGQSKALAEDLLIKWSAERGMILTILRPARMFGKGVKGEMASLFNDVVRSRYIHVRGNESRLSIVCASDVADIIKNIHSIGGIYNVSDGVGATWLQLAEAMSANAGALKRQTVLPQKWAEMAWRFASWLPAVRASLSPSVLARRTKTLTLSNDLLLDKMHDWKPFHAIDVISRECNEYPYKD
ncbi:MAG: NAD(P)-dependent oxidoreductase [Muribaculaceae bacterium]|nr:NAD(P)-dependent oxidoreductase [Muribaculaceae bacterium]